MKGSTRRGRLWCRLGRHEWTPWLIDTHEVALYRIIGAPTTRRGLIVDKLGYEYVKCLPPAWRGCRHCPVLERKDRSFPVDVH